MWPFGRSFGRWWLPGDGLDEADADDEGESEREEDCPGVGGEARRLDAMRSSCETDGKRSDESVELLIYKEFGGCSRRELATTTADGHEVQGRELAGDHHVGCSL